MSATFNRIHYKVIQGIRVSAEKLERGAFVNEMLKSTLSSFGKHICIKLFVLFQLQSKSNLGLISTSIIKRKPLIMHLYNQERHWIFPDYKHCLFTRFNVIAGEANDRKILSLTE